MNRIKNYLNRFFDEILTVRRPLIEQWVFLLFCAGLVFLSLTGFFFAWFITRGLHGYFLLLHVAAGGVFALTLAILVVLRAKLFSSPDIRKGGKISRKPKNHISINPLPAAAAWLVVIAGLFQVISSLVLMMPIFSTEINRDITALHRWVGLLTLLAALFYAYLSTAGSRGAKQ
jgi:hypothetical protein